jgi:hypothetical protein
MIEEGALARVGRTRGRSSTVKSDCTLQVTRCSYAITCPVLLIKTGHRVQLAFVTDPDEASLARPATRIQPTSTDMVEFNCSPPKRPLNLGAHLNLSQCMSSVPIAFLLSACTVSPRDDRRLSFLGQFRPDLEQVVNLTRHENMARLGESYELWAASIYNSRSPSLVAAHLLSSSIFLENESADAGAAEERQGRSESRKGGLDTDSRPWMPCFSLPRSHLPRNWATCIWYFEEAVKTQCRRLDRNITILPHMTERLIHAFPDFA